MPRTLRSAISAVTRVFDALWRCAADPGSIMDPYPWVPALRSSVKNAAPRPGHETHCFTPSRDEVVLLRRVVRQNKSRDRIDHGRVQRTFRLIVGCQIVGLVGDIDQNMIHVRQPKCFRGR